jgi:hypothetical protein
MRVWALAEYIVNNKLALAEAENTAMINLFSRSIWVRLLRPSRTCKLARV